MAINICIFGRSGPVQSMPANCRCKFFFLKRWWPLFQSGVDEHELMRGVCHEDQKKLKVSFHKIRKNTKQREQFLALVRTTKGRMASNNINDDCLHYWPEELQNRHNPYKQSGSRTDMSCKKYKFQCTTNVLECTI